MKKIMAIHFKSLVLAPLLAILIISSLLSVVYVSLLPEKIHAAALQRIFVLKEYLEDNGIEIFSNANKTFFRQKRQLKKSCGKTAFILINRIDGKDLEKDMLPSDFEERLNDVGLDLVEIKKHWYLNDMIVAVKIRSVSNDR